MSNGIEIGDDVRNTHDLDESYDETAKTTMNEGFPVQGVSEDSRKAYLALAQIRKDLEKARPMPDGTIMRFTSVGVDGRHWHYAAVFAAGSWFLTGDNSYFSRSYSHALFMARLMNDGHRIINVAIATEWEGIEL